MPFAQEGVESAPVLARENAGPNGPARWIRALDIASDTRARRGAAPTIGKLLRVQGPTVELANPILSVAPVIIAMSPLRNEPCARYAALYGRRARISRIVCHNPMADP